MSLSRRKKRWLIIIGIILAVIFILLLFANNILSNKAENVLRKEIAKIDSTAYQIDFEKVSVNVFTFSASISGITIKPTEAALEEVKRSHLAKAVFEVSIPKISVGSIGIFKALKGKEINVGSLFIDRPDITVYSPIDLFPGQQVEKPDKVSVVPSDTIAESKLREANLGSFKIRDAHVRYFNVNKEEAVLENKGLNINIDDISLDFPLGDTLLQAFNIDEFDISFVSHSMDMPGNLYRLEVGAFEADYDDQSISIDSLKIIPAYSKAEFPRIVGIQTDRFDVAVANISVHGFDFDSIMKKMLIIDSVVITQPDADIYRDKRYQLNMQHFPKLYQTSIAELPISLKVTKVHVLDAHLAYSEMVDKAAMPGQVTFSELDISITGINNNKDSISKGQSMIVNGNALLMGKSYVELHCNLPIGNENEEFTFWGKAAPFNPQHMTPMLEPLAFVAVKSGSVQGAEFYCYASKDTAVGRMKFTYSDLDVVVIKKEKENKKKIRDNRFLSWVANTGMVKNNPPKEKPVRIVRMSHVRDLNKGFFNYIWKDIQKGLTNTIIPGKKHLVEDISWPNFTANWEPELKSDWEILNSGESRRGLKKDAKIEKVEETEELDKKESRKEKRAEKKKK